MTFYNARQVFCATLTDFNGVSVKSLPGLIVLRKWRSISLRKRFATLALRFLLNRVYNQMIFEFCCFLIFFLYDQAASVYLNLVTIFQNLFVLQFGGIEGLFI